MKIEKEILILNVTEKKKSDNSLYLAITLASIDDGTPFTLTSSDTALLNVLEPFSKHIANFTLSSSKYGLVLKLDSIN